MNALHSLTDWLRRLLKGLGVIGGVIVALAGLVGMVVWDDFIHWVEAQAVALGFGRTASALVVPGFLLVLLLAVIAVVVKTALSRRGAFLDSAWLLVADGGEFRLRILPNSEAPSASAEPTTLEKSQKLSRRAGRYSMAISPSGNRVATLVDAQLSVSRVNPITGQVMPFLDPVGVPKGAFPEARLAAVAGYGATDVWVAISTIRGLYLFAGLRSRGVLQVQDGRHVAGSFQPERVAFGASGLLFTDDQRGVVQELNLANGQVEDWRPGRELSFGVVALDAAKFSDSACVAVLGSRDEGAFRLAVWSGEWVDAPLLGKASHLSIARDPSRHTREMVVLIGRGRTFSVVRPYREVANSRWGRIHRWVRAWRCPQLGRPVRSCAAASPPAS